VATARHDDEDHLRGAGRQGTGAGGLKRCAIAFTITFTIAGISLVPLLARGADTPDWRHVIASAVAARLAGDTNAAIDALENARQHATPPELRMLAASELGATLIVAHRYDDAQGALLVAYEGSTGSERATAAIDLGNLALIRHQDPSARAYFKEAALGAANDPGVRLAAELDADVLAPAAGRLALLRALALQIDTIPNLTTEARYRLNLGEQARQLGAPGVALAYANFEVALRLADQLPDGRLRVESRDALAALYEQSQRDADAERLTHEALAIAAALPAASVADLQIALEWREARLIEAHSDRDAAIAAYRRAVAHIEAVRQDIPIEYQDGRSSYNATLSPVYLGLVNLLLKDADHAPASQANTDLERVRDVLETLRQAEMQDYLGDRCTVEALQGANASPGPGTAFLYPIILPDRLELLLVSSNGITRSTTHVGSATVGRTVRAFAELLRNDSPLYQRDAAQLYDWILRPFDATLAAQQITTLVVVSDGALRLVPLGALYDGRQFALEKYAIATVTGLSMTNASAPDRGTARALVAGMSTAGPVVERLREQQQAQRERDGALPPAAAVPEGGAAAHGATRALPTLLMLATPNSSAYRDQLALPGVREEVEAITHTLNAESLLDARFTARRFNDEAGSGDYRIVHVASHGYFGGNARDSYILAYDDLVTLEDLQSLLKSDRYRQQPIELLSLSACETAEGNERSPLGMAGAAMKARAKSVLGTLWPVEDDAARNVMEHFYARLEGATVTKAEALREAQIELIQNPRTANPFFWAPFVLVGNWL
jgi:CHAT domain-containing protein